MKSPKNIVKAFTLTSLIVSSISAMADAETSAVDALNAAAQSAPVVAEVTEVAAQAATEVAKAGYLQSAKDAFGKASEAVKAHPYYTGAAVTGLVGIPASVYAYKKGWFGKAYTTAKEKAAATVEWVKENPIKTSAAALSTAALGAAAYFMPEQRGKVVDACSNGLAVARDFATPYMTTAWNWVTNNKKYSIPAATGLAVAGAAGYYFTRPKADASQTPEVNPTSTPTPVAAPAPVVAPARAAVKANNSTAGVTDYQRRLAEALRNQPRQTAPRTEEQKRPGYAQDLAKVLRAQRAAKAQTTTQNGCSTGRCRS